MPMAFIAGICHNAQTRLHENPMGKFVILAACGLLMLGADIQAATRPAASPELRRQLIRKNVPARWLDRFTRPARKSR